MGKIQAYFVQIIIKFAFFVYNTFLPQFHLRIVFFFQPCRRPIRCRCMFDVRLNFKLNKFHIKIDLANRKAINVDRRSFITNTRTLVNRAYLILF